MQMLFVLPSQFKDARKAPQPTHSDVSHRICQQTQEVYCVVARLIKEIAWKDKPRTLSLTETILYAGAGVYAFVQVQVAGVEWGTVACVTFSGWASSHDVAEREADLVKVRNG
jgi:hypothetical protein